LRWSRFTLQRFERVLLLSGLFFNQPASAETLVVSAAASLKMVVTEAGKLFEKNNPGTKLAFNFENVAYGLKARQLLADEVQTRVTHELERFAIASLRNEMPAKLSAG
jgi:energy-coupling factor transporter ATP-binding protein EcfA2